MQIETTYTVQLDGRDYEELTKALDRIEALLLFYHKELLRLKTEKTPATTLKHKREHIDTVTTRWQRVKSLINDWSSLPFESRDDYGRRWTELRMIDSSFATRTQPWPGIDEPDDPFAEYEF